MQCRRMLAVFLIAAAILAAPAMAAYDGNATSSEVDSADQALVLNELQRLWSINEHCPWGIPRGPDDATSEIVLVQRHYVLRFDNDLQCPIWVAYHLTAGDVRAPTIPKRGGKRVEAFRAEPRFRPDVIAHYKSPSLSGMYYLNINPDASERSASTTEHTDHTDR